MVKEVIKEAATVEEARLAAAQELGLDLDRVRFEVLQEPQKKKFGLFGGMPARVRGYVETTPAEEAVSYLENVLVAMGVKDATVSAEKREDTCFVKLGGQDMGFIIGRRGETLDAVQYLASLVANRADGDYCRLTVDVGNYREKREQTLKKLAKRMAAQVAKTGRKMSMEPMNPYERRIIHTAIQDFETVTSWSVGNDASRHVIIGLKEGARPSRPAGDRGQSTRTGSGEVRDGAGRPTSSRDRRPKRERTEGSREGDRPLRTGVAPDRPARQIREFVPRNNPLPTADDPAPSFKTESETEQKATLYGRIDL